VQVLAITRRARNVLQQAQAPELGMELAFG
jgi:hypothetical protein